MRHRRLCEVCVTRLDGGERQLQVLFRDETAHPRRCHAVASAPTAALASSSRTPRRREVALEALQAGEDVRLHGPPPRRVLEREETALGARRLCVVAEALQRTAQLPEPVRVRARVVQHPDERGGPRALAGEAVPSEGLVVSVPPTVWQGGGHVGLRGP
ncbi:hypothetical protein [Streptomyces sp. NPDC055912]|uniref:hypothetical protein n=1 Tax=Streptomyces sp. NPDC055912 TaxID=3345660 RepID=UPI0035E2F2A1